MATIESELVLAELPVVQSDPEADFTVKPAFDDAQDVIARVNAAVMEQVILLEGYLEMHSELAQWSEASFAAQAEILPDE